jgi:hypothetical protein
LQSIEKAYIGYLRTGVAQNQRQNIKGFLAACRKDAEDQQRKIY